MISGRYNYGEAAFSQLKQWREEHNIFALKEEITVNLQKYKSEYESAKGVWWDILNNFLSDNLVKLYLQYSERS